MSITDLYDLVPDREAPQDDSGDKRLPVATPIPIEHATTLGGGDHATVGMKPVETEIPKSGVEPYAYLASRGNGLTTHGLHPVFAERLSRALMDAEAKTGHQAVLRDLYRPPERQAQYYANYTQRPVLFGGRTYTPEGHGGGLAAPPGQSRHQGGAAADVARGPVLDYLHANAHQYGLEFLQGSAFRRDPVHVQLEGNQSGGTHGDAGRTTPVRYTSDIPANEDTAGLVSYIRQQEGSAPDQPGYEEQPDELRQLIDLRDTKKKPIEFEAIPPAPQANLQPSFERSGQAPASGVLTAQDLLNNINGQETSPALQRAIDVYNNLAGETGMSQGIAGASAIGTYLANKFGIEPIKNAADMTQRQMTIVPGQMAQDSEQTAAAMDTAMATAGARFPFVRPGEIGAGGGGGFQPGVWAREFGKPVERTSENSLPTGPAATYQGLGEINPSVLAAMRANREAAPAAPAASAAPVDPLEAMRQRLAGMNTNYEGSAVGTPLVEHPGLQQIMQDATPAEDPLAALRAAMIAQDPSVAGGVRGPTPGLTQTQAAPVRPQPAPTPPAAPVVAAVTQPPPIPPAAPPTTPAALAPVPPPPVTAAATATPRRFPRFGIIDFARSADDLSAGVIRYARRLGVQPGVLQNLRDSFRVYTGATSQTIADGAAQLGRAEAPNFVYRVRTPYPDIAAWAANNPGFNQYLHMFDTLDEINMRTNSNANLPNPQPGPIMVRGITARDAQNAIQAWERANPGFVPARDSFRGNVHETRRFAAEGEYAIMTPRQWAELNASNPNEVPMGRSRVSDATRTDLAGTAHMANPMELGGYYTTVMVRRRINNEAIGMYVDEVRARTGDEVFRPVKASDIQANPDMRPREVTFKRRGVTEHYITDSATLADLLKIDPYTAPSGHLTNFIRAGTRAFQTGTTGWLAPYFSVRDMLRNYRISQMTVAEMNQGVNPLRSLNPFDQGVRRPPSMLGVRQTLTGQGFPLGPGTIPYALASQLLPQIAKRIGLVINSGGAGYLRALIGDNATNQLGTVMANSYMRSLYAQVEAMGTHSGSYMGASADRGAALGRLQSLSQTLAQQPGMRNAAVAFRGYIQLLTAIHNSPQFAYIQRNRGNARVTRLSAEARDLTGNPQVTGAAYTPAGRRIKYDASGDPLYKRALAPVADAYSGLNELGRTAIPWYNMTQQGIKQIGAAYLHNPVEAGMRTFSYLVLPTALGYYWNQAMGTDPNGVNYVDYAMNMRDEYKRSMFNYIAVPGRPAAEGIELPSYQEAVLAKRLTEDILHHLYGSDVPETMRSDFLSALAAQVDIALVPPTPPVVQTAFAMAGYSPPQNLASFPFVKDMTGLGQLPGVGGEIYKQRDSPFDQDKALPAVIENVLRSISPAIGDIVGSASAAWTHSPKEASAYDKVRNAAKQVGRREVEKTDVLRDLANLHAPMNPNTRSAQKMFERQKEIEQLDSFFKQESMSGTIGMMDRTDKNGNVTRSEKRLSASGKGLAEQQVDFPPHTSPGVTMPPPTNPLYLQFMQQLYERTKHDSVNTGGIGYRSLWDAYRQWTEGARQLRNVDYGNMVTWNRRVQNSPDLMAYLQKYNVDPRNPIAMRNLYERKRYEVTRAINNNIDAIEYEMSLAMGRPIHLKDLDPYNNPGLTQTATPDEGPTSQY